MGWVHFGVELLGKAFLSRYLKKVMVQAIEISGLDHSRQREV